MKIKNLDYNPDESLDIVAHLIDTYYYLKKIANNEKLYLSWGIPVIVSREVAEDFHNSGLTFWQYFSKYPEKLPFNQL